MSCKGCGSSTRVEGKSITVPQKKKPLDRFSVFGLSKLKDFVVFYDLMDVLKVNIDDVRGYVASEDADEVVETARVNKISRHMMEFMNLKPKCPECGSFVDAFEVNTMRCNRVGDGLKWLMQCENNYYCGYEEGIKTDLNEWLISHRRLNMSKLKTKLAGGSKEIQDG